MSHASAPSRTPNRRMFWRIVRHLLTANRSRLFVILLALAAGAAITAALLNLQIDAKRRLTTEFRAFGANVIVTPKPSASSGSTIPLAIFGSLPSENEGQPVSKAAFLFAVARVKVRVTGVNSPGTPVVIAGYAFLGHDFNDIDAGAVLAKYPPIVEAGGYDSFCRAGESVAKKLGIKIADTIEIGGRNGSCRVTSIERFGGPEDNQIFAPLWLVAQLGQPLREDGAPVGPRKDPDQISLIELSVPGTARSVERYIAEVQKQIPDLDVHGVRQFSEAQGRIYSKISGLLTATVVLVLLLTALCVMAAMTNVAMERRNDVGLMKAIGGATRRVLRLFLTEAALLGLAGGLLGAAVGMVLSIWLGKAVFGMAARPRLIVYPISVALTIIVAIASSYPLRRLAGIRPASVFRGEA
jgi:putative ABC transport system permease protein